MFTVIVYKSKAVKELIDEEISLLANEAKKNNLAKGISGLLIFDGQYFIQYLEGPDEAVKQVYNAILKDDRHINVVKIMEDFIPNRKFCGWSMFRIDVHKVYEQDIHTLLGVGASFNKIDNLPTYDRVVKLMTAFAAARWNESEDYTNPFEWILQSRPTIRPHIEISRNLSSTCQFAFQPIISALDGSISSVEALIRSTSGGSPKDCFKGLKGKSLYEFDLNSKREALLLASQLKLGNYKISINLLPMSLVKVPNAVEKLVNFAKLSGLKPQQIIVEITEEESISNFDYFKQVLKELRLAGIGVSIDDFGAGFAGLTLLSRFQPEKLKIDRMILENIHQDGPKQAIVLGMINCARSLGITVVAEGVERIEEWCWLQSVGVDLFQGYLFAKPEINKLPQISWPIRSN